MEKSIFGKFSIFINYFYLICVAVRKEITNFIVRNK